MTKISNIQYLNIEDQTQKKHIDIFFATPSFEIRSRKIPSIMSVNAGQKIAIFESKSENRQTKTNRKFLRNLGFEEWVVDTDSSIEILIVDLLEKALQRKKSEGRHLSVLVDVSCFSRKMIATLIAKVVEVSHLDAINLSIAYSLASYTPPGKIEMAANREVAPAHPAFAGWTSSPGLPVAAIVGLGYERDKAIGAVEYLQSSDWWLFAPESPEAEYRPQVEEHNKRIIAATDRGRQISYDVLRPVDTLVSLESLVAGLRRKYKPVMLPFGPKIFFALSLLVAAVHEETSVWSVSGEANEPDIDRKPSAFVTCVSLLLQ